MDDNFFRNRIMDLAVQADSRHIYTHSSFLTPLEQDRFLSIVSSLPAVDARLYGPAGSSIRKIALFGTFENCGYEWEDPIRILNIRPQAEKFAEMLSHRDYLGAVLGLGIDRGLTGDIIIKGKQAWIYVLDSIVPFITDQLTQVKHTRVLCTEVAEDVPELAPQFLPMHVNVPSERLDVILSQAAGISRDDSKKLLKDEKVFLNGRLVSSAGAKIHAGDELVIRGFGKFIYDGIQSVTRKDRLNIVLRKYI